MVVSTESRFARAVDVVRDMARGGMSGALVGFVIGGLGGRLVMTIAASLNPDAAGLRTENGERVGEFTLSGTLALLFFGGLGGGLVAGVLWVVMAPWLPRQGTVRWVAIAVVAVALGGTFLVDSTNRDFAILGPTPVLIVLLLALVVAIGLGVALVDSWLDRRLPRAGARPGRVLVPYLVVALLGVPALALTLGAFLSPDYARAPRPPGVGYALLVVGAATVLHWIGRVRSGTPAAAPALRLVGRLGLLAASVLGVVHLADEASRLLAA